MPDAPVTPEATPATPQAGTAPVTPDAPAGNAPTLDGPFDEARALRLIENLRAENAELKASKKTTPATPAPPAAGSDDVAARIAALEEELRTSKRETTVATVAAETGVPATLLVGDTPEALKAHAEALTAWAKTLTAATAPPVPGKPRERLAPANGSQVEPEFDPEAVARRARGRF